jgi:hypothetical protein
MSDRKLEATQKAIAVMTTLLDETGDESENWNRVVQLVAEFTSDDRATGDLITGFINFGSVLVKYATEQTGTSDEFVLSTISHVVETMYHEGRL